MKYFNIQKIGLIIFSIILVSCSQKFQSFGGGGFSTSTKQLNPSKPTLKTLDDKQPIQAISLGLDSMRTQNKSIKRIESLKILKGQIQELKSNNLTLLKSIKNPIAQIKSIVSKQKYQKKNKGGGKRSGVKTGLNIAAICGGLLLITILMGLGMDPGGAGSMDLLLPIFVGFVFLLVAIIGLIYALISALIN